MNCLKHNLTVTGCSKWGGKDFASVCDECVKEVQNSDGGVVKVGPVDFGKKFGRGVENLKVKPLRVKAKRSSLGKSRQQNFLP